MILLIDNYDSFTYNLYQYFLILDLDVVVKRNDAITLKEIERLDPLAIVLSPGPGRPENAGVCVDVVRTFKGRIPILGICLGMQVIAVVLGGKVEHAQIPMHGKNSEIEHSGAGVFQGIKNPLRVTRYHSLVVAAEGLPMELEITAKTASGEIMGIRDLTGFLEGVQFHPEAVMTEMGLDLLKNFVTSAQARKGLVC